MLNDIPENVPIQWHTENSLLYRPLFWLVERWEMVAPSYAISIDEFLLIKMWTMN